MGKVDCLCNRVEPFAALFWTELFVWFKKFRFVTFFYIKKSAIKGSLIKFNGKQFQI